MLKIISHGISSSPIALVAAIAAFGASPADAQNANETQVAQLAPSASAKATAAAVPQVGVAAAVRGRVERIAYSQAPAQGSAPIGEVIASGQPIFHNDQINSGPDSGLQIILVDKTVFTIGPNSGMKIDEFVYDPNTQSGKLTASVTKGTFRFVTGQIAGTRPSDMQVKLPNATLGIRGTIVAGSVEGNTSQVVLLGPGNERSGIDRIGRLTVTSTGGNSVELNRPGFGTVVQGNAPPLPAFRLPPEQTARMNQTLTAKPQPVAQEARQQEGNQPGQQNQQQGPQPQQGPQQGQQQGQQQASGEGRGQQLAVNRGETANFATFAQVNGIKPPPLPPPPVPVSSLSSQTNWDQLRGIPQGSATFAQSSLPLNLASGTGSGTYGYSVVFNFGARTTTVDVNANITSLNGTSYNGNVYNRTSPGNYNNNIGVATGSWNSAVNTNNFNAGFLATGINAVINVSLHNDVNQKIIAKSLDFGLELTKGGSKLAGNTTTTR